MHNFKYPILVAPKIKADGGGFSAIVPDLPGCISNAETPEGAVAKIQDAVRGWIEERENKGQAIPPPSRHHTAIWAALKAE